MELLRQQVFEHRHMGFVAGNPNRGCFAWQTLGSSVDQNLDMLLVEMKFAEFALVATKGFIHQDYNPNLYKLDSVDMYHQIVFVASHKMVDKLVNK